MDARDKVMPIAPPSPCAATRECYDRTAGEYERRWGNSDVLAPAIRKFTALVPPETAVLDAGCGTGRDLVALGRHSRVVGIDLSQPMLEIARTKGIEELVLGDLSRQPFDDESFGGCWAAASLLHIPKSMMEQSLKEVRRVLTPDGFFFLCLKEGSGEGFGDSAEDGRYFAFYRKEEIEELTTRSGFVIHESWTSADEAGREPWLNWILQRNSNS